MNFLSLDLGTVGGWALYADGEISSGFKNFNKNPKSGSGMRYLEFEKWLQDLYEKNKFKLIIYESVKRHTGCIASHVYGGFLATVTKYCEFLKIPYLGIGVGTIKKFITGNGKASKEFVIECLNATYNTNIINHNEADALSLLYLFLQQQEKSYE